LTRTSLALDARLAGLTNVTDTSLKRIPGGRKELPSVSIQEDLTEPTVLAVKANQSTEGDRPSHRWPPLWALPVIYLVVIAVLIVIGIAFFGSH
jgi:hypothetical protein